MLPMSDRYCSCGHCTSYAHYCSARVDGRHLLDAQVSHMICTSSRHVPDDGDDDADINNYDSSGFVVQLRSFFCQNVCNLRLGTR